jgi:hypothetical protein
VIIYLLKIDGFGYLIFMLFGERHEFFQVVVAFSKKTSMQNTKPYLWNTKRPR